MRTLAHLKIRDMPRRKKTGPKQELYRKMLGEQASATSPPQPNGRWRDLSMLENSRLRGMRVLWFRQNQAHKFKVLAKRVKKMRARMKMTQREFAQTLGVSAISVRRWELALGYTPLLEHLKRLEELEASIL